MSHFFNNCRGRRHVSIYERPDAFFDLNPETHPTPEQIGLKPGDECIVASYGQNRREVVISRFTFANSQILPDDRGDPCRVLFGASAGSETMSKADAASHDQYSAFFNRAGHFLQRTVC